jgi:hypothetical protein
LERGQGRANSASARRRAETRASGEEQNAVLARAVLGGVVVGTMTTLLFVPFLYSIIGRFERSKSKAFGAPAYGASLS